MEDEQKILEIQDHASGLADHVAGDSVGVVSPGLALAVVELVQMLSQDVMWLIKKVRQHEHEKNQYKEQVEILLGEKDLNL